MRKSFWTAEEFDDPLHNPEAVEHRRQGGEADDDRQHLEGEDETDAFELQDAAEEELYPRPGGVYDGLDALFS